MKASIRSFIGNGIDLISSAYFDDLDSGSTLYRNQANPHYNFFAKWQRQKLLSKYTLTGGKDTREAAISKFLANQNRLRGIHVPDTLLLKRAKSWVKLILDQFDLEELYESCKMSSGTDVGGTYAFCNIEDKFAYPLTGNAHAIHQFEDYLEWDPQLSEALDVHNCMSTAPKYQEVNEARLTTVPKNSATDRCILIGAKLNMFFQQGLMTLIERRLQNFGIDISSQADLHRDWVFPMSITHSHATIDFASASDSISLELCRYLLPREWFVWLLRFRESRCQFGTFPMIASMGNAYTFPLETLVFYALALAVTQRGNPMTTLADASILVKSRVSVFGDDVIIENLYAQRYIDLCESVGLVVNADKSFYGCEFFRESCGVDVFDYRNVRPWYISTPDRDTRTWSHVHCYFVGLFNSFLKKAKPVFGNWIYACKTVNAFASVFKMLGRQVCVVPSDYPDTAGLHLWEDPLMRRVLWESGVVFSRITVDFHGTYRFRYFSKRYSDLQGSIFEDLHYWFLMKFKRGTSMSHLDPVPIRYLIREKSQVVSSVGFTYLPLGTST